MLTPYISRFCARVARPRKLKRERKRRKAEGATAFVLDTSKITVGTVTVDGQRARWVQHRRHGVYGSALDIRLPGAEAGTVYAKGQLLQVCVCVCMYVCMYVCFVCVNEPTYLVRSLEPATPVCSLVPPPVF